MIHLYFGDGKGKTTAAAGLAVRACGSGWKVVFAQFMKGRESGETRSLTALPGVFVLRSGADGKFTFQMDQQEREDAAEKNADLLESVFKEASERNAQLVVLDEAVTAVSRQMISGTRLKELISYYSDDFEIVLTGHQPEKWMMEAADYITEMKKIKHPYDSGVNARKGIES